MRTLGISAFYHDSSVALVDNGRIIAAAQEERFSRIKHDARFPHGALAYCLAQGKIDLGDIDLIVFYDKPFLKFERLLETYLAFAPAGFKSFRLSMPLWLREKLFQKSLLISELKKHSNAPAALADRLLFTEHHLGHAASAYYPSPFDEAAVLTMDGVGEWATSTVAIGKGNTLTISKEIHFPHSLGLLYSAFTYHTGFKVNSGEYKLMGLAPYGTPCYSQLILDNLIDLKADGSFRLNLKYFDYCTGLTMTNDCFTKLFGCPPRRSEELLMQQHMDLAASIQSVTEEVVLRMSRSISRDTGLKNLCLAGGVALNCVANGKLLRSGIFERIWIQPAAGDAGGALGAALAAYYQFGRNPRVAPDASKDSMMGSFLGPEFSQLEIEQRLAAAGAVFQVLEDRNLLEAAATDLASGKALGWFQGRMEFGPRALGARSILGDPRSASMQSVLNLKVKYRESFRPFAPAVLREDVADWFDIDVDSPYMLLVADISPKRRVSISSNDLKQMREEPDLRRRVNVVRSVLPAITHVDYSARVQTVDRERNPQFHALLQAFKAQTGCPVIVNTSFNVRGEPIVGSPEDAFNCFMGTGIEAMAIGNCYLRKEAQNSNLKKNYEQAFELD